MCHNSIQWQNALGTTNKFIGGGYGISVYYITRGLSVPLQSDYSRVHLG